MNHVSQISFALNNSAQHVSQKWDSIKAKYTVLASDTFRLYATNLTAKHLHDNFLHKMLI